MPPNIPSSFNARVILRALWPTLFLLAALSPFFLPSHAEAVSNQGLVGYWSFNEGTSTKATDFSGNGNTGTLFNFDSPPSASSGWTNGKRGQALRFAGDDDTVGVTDTGVTSLEFAPNGTWSAWVKLDANNNTPVILQDDGFAFFVDSSAKIALYVTPDAGAVAANTTVSASVWHHLVAVKSGPNVTFYLDGVSDGGGTVSSAIIAGGADLWIGSDSGTSNYVDGIIDEVRIYNRALTAAEVAELYRTGAVLNKPPNNLGLVGYWSFNEGTSTIATDFSGNGNAGTLTTSGTIVPQWTNGKRGKALSFGSGDQAYVDAGTGSSLSQSGAMTVCTWFFAPDVNDGDIAIVGNGAADTTNGQYFLEVFNGGSFVFTWSDSTPTYEHTSTAGGTIQNGVWYHGCGVRSAGGVGTVYLNGVDRTASTENDVTPPSSAGGNTTIGRLGLFGEYWEGTIDEVRVYNRALSASEVRALYGGGAVRMNASSVDLQRGSTLASGLVGHWTFDGPDVRWSSATAGVAYDRSGNNNTGTLSGMSQSGSPTAGKLGQALVFDNSGDFITAANSTSLNITGALTIALWMKKNSLADFDDLVGKGDGGTDRVQYALETMGDELLFFYCAGTEGACTGTGGALVTTDADLTTGTWYHVVVAYDDAADNIAFYVDGVPKAESVFNGSPETSSIISTTNSLKIGTMYASDPADGILDDVRVYNRALSPAEVAQLYKFGQVIIRP